MKRLEAVLLVTFWVIVIGLVLYFWVPTWGESPDSDGRECGANYPLAC